MGREAGFLLLTSTLGNPARKVLTSAQLRTLARRAALLQVDDPDRDLTAQDIQSMGYSLSDAQRIIALLSAREQLAWYLQKAQKTGAYPVTRVSSQYPQVLRHKLGRDCPGCLWMKGNIALLGHPAVGLVGSRDLHPANLEFAREAGRQAAQQGYVLVSGNARGADREAQNACLEQGGSVICVIADCLAEQKTNDQILYISEEGFDLHFTPQRALHRNIIVHCLAQKMLVAQCGLEKGGTWSGVQNNLRGGFSPVFCFDDGTAAAEKLSECGVQKITVEDLNNLSALQGNPNFFE